MYVFISLRRTRHALTFENEMINDRRSSTGLERVSLFVSKTIVPPPPKQRPSPACRRCEDVSYEENRVLKGKRPYVYAADPSAVLLGQGTGLIRIALIKPFSKGFPSI